MIVLLLERRTQHREVRSHGEDVTADEQQSWNSKAGPKPQSTGCQPRGGSPQSNLVN